MEYPVGTRVGALLSADAAVVKLLGYGVYEGDHTLDALPFANPRIKLDNGDTVWGYQCWWGPEDQIKEHVKSYEALGARTIEVSITS